MVFFDLDKMTPVHRLDSVYLKRDDLFSFAGVCGGKVRSCLALAYQTGRWPTGLITAGSRQSPQVNIVAQIANYAGILCRIHTPTGEPTPELASALKAGAIRISHKAGYNTVIVRRAKDDYLALAPNGWAYIPFGMECWEAVRQTAKQTQNIPWEDIQRIVVPVGSGMSLAGILWGMAAHNVRLPVLGVTVGASPEKRLDEYAPRGWREIVSLVQAKEDYHSPSKGTCRFGLTFDPIYEAKALEQLQANDLFWVIGIRQTAPKEAKEHRIDYSVNKAKVGVAAALKQIGPNRSFF